MKAADLIGIGIALLVVPFAWAASPTEKLSKTGTTEIFHNMDTQQYTSVWLKPIGNDVYSMHMQCQNGQQWAVFRYTMHIIFRDKDGHPLQVYRQNCDLPGRHVGHNQKQIFDANIDISGVANRVTQVSLWGQRRGPSGFWSAIEIKPKSLQELFFPVCWGNPQSCRDGDAIPIRSSPKLYWAGIHVDCIDADNGRPRGDQEMRVSSQISLQDAEDQLKQDIDSVDRGQLDLCQGPSGDRSRKEKPGTRRKIEFS